MLNKMQLRPLLRAYKSFKQGPKTLRVIGAFLMLSFFSMLSPAWPIFNHILSPYLNFPMLETLSQPALMEIFRFSYVLVNHPTLLEQINLITIFVLVGHLIYMMAMYKGSQLLIKRLDTYVVDTVA
jgi:hypothetical protein